jgi:hypothetical protein
MTREELQQAARRQPFEPFRILLTTGTTYDIRHPDLIWVGARSAMVGITHQPDRTVYDYTIKIDLLHIVALEELPLPPSSSSNGPVA